MGYSFLNKRGSGEPKMIEILLLDRTVIPILFVLAASYLELARVLADVLTGRRRLIYLTQGQTTLCQSPPLAEYGSQRWSNRAQGPNARDAMAEGHI